MKLVVRQIPEVAAEADRAAPLATWPVVGKAGEGGCFIATAAYGSPMAREVQILREFRNRYLLSHTPGRQLVGVYNSLSPPLARAIAQSDALRSLVRTALHPVLWWVYLFLWSPVLAGGVLLGMPITTSCLILRVTRRYRPVTTPR